MINNIKTLTTSALMAVFLTACTSTTVPFEKQTQLKEANKCQVISKKEEKNLCYDKISTSNAIAKLRLGVKNATIKNYDKAFTLFTSAKDMGNYYANLPLAYLYFKGTGVEKDLNKALDLLKESSNKDVNASFQLSKFYFDGLVIKKDSKKAIELLEFSANKNMFIAQKHLAIIYAKGLYDITKDQTKAQSWAKKAEANKNDTTFDIYKF